METRNPVIRKILEAERTAVILGILDVFLNSIIVFVIFAILLSLVSVNGILAFIPTTIYLFLDFAYRNRSRNIIALITKRNTFLDERLQTVCDNQKESNIIIDNLTKNVSKDMDKVAYSSFLDSRRIVSKTALTVFLLFIFLTINFLNLGQFSPIDPSLFAGIQRNALTALSAVQIGEGGIWEVGNYSTEKEKEKIGGEAGGQTPGVSEGPIPGRGGGAGSTPESNIFGEESSVEIWGENMEMEVHPEYGGDIEIEEVGTGRPGETEEFSLSTPEGYRQADQEPVEFEKIIKRYFEKLVEESE